LGHRRIDVGSEIIRFVQETPNIVQFLPSRVRILRWVGHHEGFEGEIVFVDVVLIFQTVDVDGLEAQLSIFSVLWQNRDPTTLWGGVQLL